VGDLDAVIEMFSDDEAKRWYPTTSQPKQAEQWIQWNLQNYQEHGVGLWVIEDLATSEFVGDCGITYQTVLDDQIPEIGYHLTKAKRGEGYAGEAARQCKDFAFQTLDAARVCSIVDPLNESSRRVAGALHTSHRRFINNRGNERDLFWTDRLPL